MMYAGIKQIPHRRWWWSRIFHAHAYIAASHSPLLYSTLALDGRMFRLYNNRTYRQTKLYTAAPQRTLTNSDIIIIRCFRLFSMRVNVPILSNDAYCNSAYWMASPKPKNKTQNGRQSHGKLSFMHLLYAHFIRCRTMENYCQTSFVWWWWKECNK